MSLSKEQADERVAQLDCVLAVLQSLASKADDEPSVYYHRKVVVDVDRAPSGRWQILASHKDDPVRLTIIGTGDTVHDAISEACRWVRGLILADGDLFKAERCP